jgi:hypothetical protein
MTLLSMYKRDDSRTVYRILAEQAVRYFDHPRAGTESKILLTNLSRLLERYRCDAFTYDDAPGILEVFKTEGEELRTNHVSASAKASLDVIPALEAAHAHVYHSVPRDEVVESLKALFVDLATNPVPDNQNRREDFVKARLFFVALFERLKERHT